MKTHTNYFARCKDIAELKKRYKELAMINHPDKGGCTATMQAINAEYAYRIKSNDFEQTAEERKENIEYPAIINEIINLEGIIIEICGNWIWVSGQTYVHKEVLKKTGFYFAPKKTMWYHRPAEYKSAKHKPVSIDEIRAKYGTFEVTGQSRKINAIA